MFISFLKSNISRNAIAGFLSGYGIVAFVCFFVLVHGWAGTGPRTADTAHGYIYAHNEHGSITYFTAFQGTSCVMLLATAVMTIFLGMRISPKKNTLSKSGWGQFRPKWVRNDDLKVYPMGMLAGAIAAPVLIFQLGPSLIIWLNSIGIITRV